MHVLLAFALHLRWKNHHCAGDTIMFLSVPRIACALAFITVLAGPAMPTARAADPILIGFSAPLTGDAAGSGQESLNGAKLAVEQINAKGGVLGRPLQLVQGDDRCDPKDAAIVAQKFVAQKVAAAASHYCSGAALAAIPIFRDAGTLYVDWGAVSSKIPGSGYDRLFITIYNGAQPGVYAADIAVKKLGMKKLAVVDDRTPADAEFAAAFQKHAKELGAEIVLSGHVTQGDKDFSAFVTQVKGSGAQMLFTGNYYAEAGLLNRQLRDQQVSDSHDLPRHLHGSAVPCHRRCRGRGRLQRHPAAGRRAARRQGLRCRLSEGCSASLPAISAPIPTTRSTSSPPPTPRWARSTMKRRQNTCTA